MGDIEEKKTRMNRMEQLLVAEQTRKTGRDGWKGETIRRFMWQTVKNGLFWGYTYIHTHTHTQTRIDT